MIYYYLWRLSYKLARIYLLGTSASIEACGASEGGSIPPSCPIFYFLFCSDMLVHHHY